jgi:NADP-dependent 3-hydroxy acid dehydrogenase YdfG
MSEKPVAIVTGVGPGTGAAIVKRFSAGGFRIIALARSAELINRLAQELLMSTRRPAMFQTKIRCGPSLRM